MSVAGNITEVNITSTQGKTGNFSSECPYDSGTTERRNWFQRLVKELAKSEGNKTFRLSTGSNHVVYYLDRSLVSAVTVTFT